MFLVFRWFEESLEHHSNIGFFSALCSPHKPQLATCNPKKPAPSLNRHLLQLHHVYGRIVGGVDSSGAQLSPSHSGHPRDATVGELIISKHSHCSPPDFCLLGCQIKSVFLQWLPWILRMGRPGRKITRKTILLSNRMKELELKERSSKSLLANVLDIDDDFRHTISGSQTAIGSSA